MKIRDIHKEEMLLRDCERALYEAGYPDRHISKAMELLGTPPSRRMLKVLLKARKTSVTADDAIKKAARIKERPAVKSILVKAALPVAISAIALLIALYAMA